VRALRPFSRQRSPGSVDGPPQRRSEQPRAKAPLLARARLEKLCGIFRGGPRGQRDPAPLNPARGPAEERKRNFEFRV